MWRWSVGLDPLPIKGVLAEMGKRAGLGHPLETGYVWAHWRAIVGDVIADHARPSSLRDGVLRVRAASPVWATEIGYMAEEIRTRVNGALDAPLVRAIKVWTAPEDDARIVPVSPAAPAPNGPPERVLREVPDDPRVALERARAAWERKAAGRRGRRP